MIRNWSHIVLVTYNRDIIFVLITFYDLSGIIYMVHQNKKKLCIYELKRAILFSTGHNHQHVKMISINLLILLAAAF